MKRKGITLAVLLAVAIVGVWIVTAAPGWFSGRGGTTANEPAGDRAPDFVLKDLKGAPFRLHDQQGKPVLLVFGTTWCPSCREEIPRLKEIHARYADRGLVLVNIDVRESAEKVSRFAENNELPYRLLLDEDGAVSERYGVRGVPTLMLLDETGKIVGGERFIDEQLERMFANRPSIPGQRRL